ncbi:hypothetical protein [Microbacterium allomyrinae]|uniref:Uncharacterized protein n=1 Tax=Microbacterium allomyrinae TaxID=2830666 RepID=A0A9X1S1B5_9MICO|nr:hypothetical protein [Microbacterium allomyrinae]MCC2030644.1 hypothetical protein [Microbacterium allomyrinae]
MTVDEMRAKLAYSRRRLEAANEAKAHAETLSASAREMGGAIPGFGGSGNQRAARQMRGAYGRADAAHKDADERIEKWKYRIRSLERRIAGHERVRFTAADLKGVTHVRTSTTWRKVVRVNAKSVTVATPYSWTDRIAIDQVREHRTVTS